MLVFQGRKARLTCLAFSPDGRTLAASGYGGAAQLWDLDARRMTRAVVTGWWKHDRVFFLPGGGRLLVFSCNSLFLFDLSAPEQAGEHIDFQRLHYNYPGLSAVALSADGRAACLASRDAQTLRPSLEQVTLPDLGPIWNQPAIGEHVASALAFSADARRLASASSSGRVTVRDAKTGAVGCELTGHPSEVKSIALSPDGRAVAWCVDSHLHLWRLDPLQEVAHHRLGKTHFFSVVFHPSGEFLATANGDGKVDYWDAQTGERREAFDWGVGKLHDVAFDPAGDRAACCANSGQIVVWDVD